MRINFREISRQRDVKVNCIACNKLLRRTIKEFQTVNPFNKGADGFPKTEDQIRRELPAQIDRAEAKLKTQAICRTCESLGHRINYEGVHVLPDAAVKAHGGGK